MKDISGVRCTKKDNRIIMLVKCDLERGDKNQAASIVCKKYIKIQDGMEFRLA